MSVLQDFLAPVEKFKLCFKPSWVWGGNDGLRLLKQTKSRCSEHPPCTASSAASWEPSWMAGASEGTSNHCGYPLEGETGMTQAHFHCLSTNTTFGKYPEPRTVSYLSGCVCLPGSC